MKTLSLNVEDLSVESFDTLSKKAQSELGLGLVTQLDSCSCLVDCRTATVGRCCPP